MATGINILLASRKSIDMRLLELAEHRKQALNGLLEQETLPQLLDIVFLQHDSVKTDMKYDAAKLTVVADPGLDLKTQGIFHATYPNYPDGSRERRQQIVAAQPSGYQKEWEVHTRDGTAYLWGISRDPKGQWLLATAVVADFEYKMAHHQFQTKTREKVTAIEIRVSSLNEILRVTGESAGSVCKKLSEGIELISKRVTNRYERLQGLAATFRAEDMVIDELTRKLS